MFLYLPEFYVPERHKNWQKAITKWLFHVVTDPRTDELKIISQETIDF